MNQDRLAEQHSIRQSVEQFQRIVNVMNSATGNTRGHLKDLVRKLYDEGRETQGDALDKQFQAREFLQVGQKKTTHQTGFDPQTQKVVKGTEPFRR